VKLPLKIVLIIFFGLFIDLLWTQFLVVPLTNYLLLIFKLKNDLSFAWIISVLVFSVIPGTILVWFLLMRTIIQPLETLKQITKVIADGNLGKHVDIQTKDEIGDIATNVNQLIKNQVTAYQSMANSLMETKEKKEALALSIEQLKSSKAQDEALLTSIGDGVIAIGTSGLIIFANKSAELTLGWGVEEMIGKTWQNFLTAYEQNGKETTVLADQPIVRTLKNGLKMRRDCIFNKKDNSHFPAAINLSPIIVNNTVSGAILVFRDITIEKEIDRMKTEFISLASHQLRTPLSAIRWFTELLEDGTGGALKPEQKELVENINESTLRMIDLVNSLLNISRIESGRIIVDPKPTDLAELVNDLIKELQVKINEREQHLIVSVHEQLPKINVDPKLIRQVYQNLLTNAIKYTPKGGQISVFISRKDDQLISQISDTGYGIPKDQVNKVFDKFFRAENVIKVETDGNGLGLYLVKAIVESSHGRIWFQSEEGKGTTFWFSLPLTGMEAKKGEVELNG
jgi:PAS domain S-box-containing protein